MPTSNSTRPAAAAATVLLGTLLALVWPVAGETANTVRPDAAVASDTLRLPAPKQARARPLAVIVADNAGTETTDFIVPYSVLKEADVAQVLTVSTGPDAVTLMPALRIRTDMTMAQFDAATPSGADIVIVPAMHNPHNRLLVDWLRTQAQKGAAVVAICEGAWVAADAGVLDGKAATTHWSAMDKIARQFPATRWVRNRRYVADGRVMTTTGVSASVPASLALVDAIAGPERAEATARRLGVPGYGPEHDSGAYRLTASRALLAATNWLALWRHEDLEMPVDDGVDELSLALAADAWSRTWRSTAYATHPARDTVHSLRGLRLETEAPATRIRIPLPGGAPGTAIDTALAGIGARYGARTADFVALQLEYPLRQR